MKNNTFKAIIALFLQVLYKEIETKAFLNICFKDMKRTGIITKTFPISHVDHIAAIILAQREKGDVYLEVCLQSEPPKSGKRGRADGVKVVPGFWVDIDIAGPNHKSTEYPKSLDDALKFVYSLPWRASVIVCSGGGIHVYYLFTIPVVINSDSDRANMADLSRRVNRYVIQEGQKHGWKIDNTSDLARLLRVPATLNHKSSPAREVFIIEYDPTALYSVEDFQVVFDEEVVQVEGIKPEVREVLPTKISNNLPVATDFPEADIEFIESHCSWMAHCRYDAALLQEPEWFAACSIWARCINGEVIAHERSQPYPGYTPTETNRKLENVFNGGPRTCESISDLTAGQYCNSCPFRREIKSPISLGNSQPIPQARFKLAKIIAETPKNPQLPFEDESLAALALLQCKSTGYYLAALNSFKKIKITKGALENAIASFLATADMTLDDVANYEVVGNCICVNKATAYGMSKSKLANFDARVTEQIIRNDGSTSDRYYRIEGVLKTGDLLPAIVLPVNDFESMNWIGQLWGAKAWYAAGAAIRDNLRAAITYLSKDIPTKHIYTHTGWTKISGDWIFLTEAGAIGKEGVIDSITVDLSGSNLSDFAIPESNGEISITEAIKKCFLVLELLPKCISYPLLSSVFRAPLGEALPVTFALFIVGATGTRKSEVAAIAQGFYGCNFNGKNLPSNWTSTANALEKHTFQTKDVVVVVDDYLPGENSRQMIVKADRLMRGAGNQGGRQRMTVDIGFRDEYYPRGLIISTGEDVPAGQSLTGRMLVLEIAEGEVDLDVLTELQGLSVSGVLNAVMYYHLKWLAPQMENLSATLASHRADLRKRAVEAEKTHTRTPDTVADLFIGFESLCAHGVSCGVITEDESDTLQEECWSSLIQAAVRQQSQQNEGDPCKRFRDLLIAAFVLGKAHLESMTGSTPSHYPERWGWKCSSGATDNTGIPNTTYYSDGSRIGWVDGPYVYLNSEGAFKIAQDVGGRDRPITSSLKTLRTRLAERKHLVKSFTGGLTVRKRINGNRVSVMQIQLSFFDDDDTNESSLGNVATVSVPEFRPRDIPENSFNPTGAQRGTIEENLFKAFSNASIKK